MSYRLYEPLSFALQTTRSSLVEEIASLGPRNLALGSNNMKQSHHFLWFLFPLGYYYRRYRVVTKTLDPNSLLRILVAPLWRKSTSSWTRTGDHTESATIMAAQGPNKLHGESPRQLSPRPMSPLSAGGASSGIGTKSPPCFTLKTPKCTSLHNPKPNG